MADDSLRMKQRLIALALGDWEAANDPNHDFNDTDIVFGRRNLIPQGFFIGKRGKLKPLKDKKKKKKRK